VLFPDRVAKLVLVDAGGKVPDDVSQFIAASVNRLGTPFPSLDAYLTAMSALPVFTWNPFWEQYFRYDAEIQPDGTVLSRVPKAVAVEELTALSYTRTEEQPPHVQAPTLIVRAALGTLAPDKGFVLPREEAERLVAVMPNARLEEVPDTNHYTIALPPAFLETVVNFLS
jgi:pimeloyl-ACP methyl ester carboxylesterase